MEKILTNNLIDFPSNDHVAKTSFTFVTELLTMALDEQNDELLIEALDIRYNKVGSIKINGTIKVEIDYKKIVERKNRIEFHLSGNVENKLQQKRYTLYFCMWTDNRAKPLFENDYGKILESLPVTINLKNCFGSLADSVFELHLYIRNQGSMCCSLGHGKGYLVCR